MRRASRIAVLLLALGAALALSLVAYVVAEFSRPVLSEYANRLRFESAAWKAERRASDPMWPVRLRMVDDLLARISLAGMTREAVIELLGPPDNTPYFAAPGRMVYYLGPERGMFRIDSEWLVVETRDGKVTAAAIWTD